MGTTDASELLPGTLDIPTYRAIRVDAMTALRAD